VLAATSQWGPAGRALAAAADAAAHRSGAAARPVLLFYGGKIHTSMGEADPSGRAQLWIHHKNRPGFRVVSSWNPDTEQPIQINSTFADEMPNATFCYSPLGHDAGDTDRYIPAILFGCIPVMLSGTVRDGHRVPMALPLEEHPEMDWPSFAVLIELADVANLHEILGRITHEQLRRMRHALARVWRRVLWTSIYGSYLGEDAAEDAFETMMGVLRWRLPGMGLATKEELLAQEAADAAAHEAARRRPGRRR
jgi:hypothetical protein